MTPTPSEVGPKIVYLGAVNQTQCAYCQVPGCYCTGVPWITPTYDSSGRRIFTFGKNIPFILVIEARPGANSVDVGTTLQPSNPATPPSLQILLDRNAGNGDSAVDCRTSPGSAKDWGGIPAVSIQDFSGGQATVDAMTDLSCRFEPPATSSDDACTLDYYGNPSFLNPNPSDPKVRQFCHLLLKSELFAVGDTLVTVRVLDKNGNPGPSQQIIVRVSP